MFFQNRFLVQQPSRKIIYQESAIQLDDNRVLSSFEFKIWNLNSKHDWKQV